MMKYLTPEGLKVAIDYFKDYIKTSPDPDNVKIKTILKKIYNLYHNLACGKPAAEKEIEKTLEGIE